MQNDLLSSSDEEPQPPGNQKDNANISATGISENPLSGRTILLVNTGYIKKRFIISLLKKSGLTVVVLNKQKNWAAPYTDHWILADTANHDESLKALDEFISAHPEVKIEGAVTFWEDDVLLTSKIIDKYGFKGIPFSISSKIRNKYEFRKFCEESGLPAPMHRLIKSEEDIEFINKNFKYPLVIKPALGSSSAFVVKVENTGELKKTVDYIKKTLSTKVESALTDGSDILAEEYIEGDEVDIDILIQNGEIKYYSITDNDRTNEPFFVETGDAIPTSLPYKKQDKLISLAEKTLKKIGIINGCIHYEAKATKSGPYPIEVNLRMGGDQTYDYVKKAWGMDLVEGSAKIALGIDIPKITRPENPNKYLIGQYFLARHTGTLKKYRVSPGLKREKFVEDLQFFKDIGDTVLAPPDGYEYLGWIIVSGDTMRNTKNNLKTALKHITFDIAEPRKYAN